MILQSDSSARFFVALSYSGEKNVYKGRKDMYTDDENAALIEDALGTLGVDNIPAPYTHNYTLIVTAQSIPSSKSEAEEDGKSKTNVSIPSFVLRH